MAKANSSRSLDGAIIAPYPQIPGQSGIAEYTGWNYGVTASPAAFTGGTANSRGDYDGTGMPLTLFTVTGVCLVKLFAICTVSLTGATATIEVGVAGNTAGLIAQTTATDLLAGEIWLDASPTTMVESSVNVVEKIVAKNIIETLGTANVTAGNMIYYCYWYPLSADGLVA